jgi:magnesium chelatase subunit I
MHAEIRTVKDPILRVKLWKNVHHLILPMVWIENYESQQQQLMIKCAAQKLLPTVELNMTKSKISEVCSQLDVDGLRGDIVTNRAAKAYAAYNGRIK